MTDTAPTASETETFWALPEDPVLTLLERGLTRVNRGWIKRRWRGAGGRVCGIEAIDGKDNSHRPVHMEARGCLEDALGGRDVMRYNDRLLTRKRHVVEMYERAIATRRLSGHPDPRPFALGGD